MGPALRAARHEVRFTDIFVEHTGYRDPTVLRHKIERNVRLLQLQEAEEPNDRLTLFHLGWAYHDLGQLVRALEYLRRSLALCRPRDSIVSKLYVLMAECHSALGQRSEALAACQAGVARCPNDVELLFQQGRLLREQGEGPAGTQECLRPLLPGATGTHFASFDADIHGFKSGR
jgi:tetratricopeptide (TPR) repeat protein